MNPKPTSTWQHWLTLLGPVRACVALIALLCLPMVFLSGGEAYEGWRIIPDQVVPGLVVLIVWALPFDILMIKVFMSDQDEAAKARGRQVIRIDLLLIILLLLFWVPFFMRVLS